MTSAREHVYDLRQLEDYTSMDEFGRDQGVNGTVVTCTFFLILKP